MSSEELENRLNKRIMLFENTLDFQVLALGIISTNIKLILGDKTYFKTAIDIAKKTVMCLTQRRLIKSIPTFRKGGII